MKVLILACPCSGTKFTKGFLRQLGLDFGFEVIRENGGIGWMYVAEKDFTVFGKYFPKTNFEDFDFIFHQVRNPLEVVRTMAVETHPVWEYIEGIIGKCKAKDKLEKHLWFWTKWNVLCEEKAQLTYRVESLPIIVNNRHLKTNTNTKRHRMKLLPKPTWEEVRAVYPEAFNLAQKYGYCD